ncbi:DUF6284 family protein [Streptomyces sp. NPDC051561]|uniref:DUF6284 family protein n=1 Tax=Streptomyces sp. NPDC051561 TaxID=3365658 RepID=UPI0037999ED0
MDHIVTVQEAVTAFADWREPTGTELDAIEAEMPVICAEVAWLDAQIIALNHPTPNELDARRVRRAHNRVLAARRDLENRAATASLPGGAA